MVVSSILPVVLTRICVLPRMVRCVSYDYILSSGIIT